jgi:hypothetical protein
MKKAMRKLAVSRETLARLDAQNLRQLAAGARSEIDDTVYHTEPVSIDDTVYHPVESDQCSLGCGDTWV